MTNCEVIPLSNEEIQWYKPTCSAGIRIWLCNYKLASIGNQQFRHEKKETSNYSQDVLQKPMHTEVVLTKTRMRRRSDEALPGAQNIVHQTSSG